jgi:hypothetical protein
LLNPKGLETVGDLREVCRDAHGTDVDPEDIWSFEDEMPYSVRVFWPGPGDDHSFNVLFQRHVVSSHAEATVSLPRFPPKIDGRKPWHAYANNPLSAIQTNKVIPHVRRFLRGRLPEYMVPVSFVILEAMPLTPSGKLNRSALPDAELSRPAKREAYALPRTRTEETIATIWAHLVGVERVGAYDNFFELGGHSLLATRALSRMRDAFHVELPLRAIFEAPTVAGLARLVEEAKERGDVLRPIITRLSREAHSAVVLPGGGLDPQDLVKGRRGTANSPAKGQET